MFCINLESEDPFFNLAIEEVLLKNSREEYLILGVNTPSVIIGKHQSAHMEIDTKFITENDIPVIRRISGGGTVFHDRGNLNFTFIKQSETGKQVDFKRYTKPVIDYLLSLGVEAKFEGKNDIKAGGLKISGNAEHVHRNRILHHGTLLFSSSQTMLRNSLRRDASAYSSRAVKSNPSSVINLNEILGRFRNIYEFRHDMMNYLMETLPDMQACQPSEPETEQAELLASAKYKTWEWIWAYGPEYYFANRFEIEGSLVSLRMFIKGGIIRECDIEGPYEITASASKLVGCRHMVSDLMEVLQKDDGIMSDIDIFNFF